MATQSGMVLSDESSRIFERVVETVAITVAFDSLMKKPTPKIIFNIPKMMQKAIIAGVYIKYFEGQITYEFSDNANLQMAFEFILEVLVRTGAEIVTLMSLNWLTDNTPLEDIIPIKENISFTIAGVLFENFTSALFAKFVQVVRMSMRQKAPGGSDPVMV